MKLPILLLVASLGAVATTSFADVYHPSNAEEGVILHPLPSSSLQRADVQTNVMGAQRDGTLSWISRGYSGTYPLVQGPKLSNSRNQVEADLRVWQKNPVTPDGKPYVPGEIGWGEARLSAAERPPQMCVNVCPAHKPGKSQ